MFGIAKCGSQWCPLLPSTCDPLAHSLDGGGSDLDENFALLWLRDGAVLYDDGRLGRWDDGSFLLGGNGHRETVLRKGVGGYMECGNGECLGDIACPTTPSYIPNIPPSFPTGEGTLFQNFG